MKSTKTLLSICALSMLLSSCIKDPDCPLQGNEEKGRTTVTLSLSDADGYNSRSAVTRSNGEQTPGEASERIITSIEFYIFDEQGKRVENGYYKIKKEDNEASIDLKKKYKISLEKGTKKFLAAVNMDLGELAGATFSEVKNATQKPHGFNYTNSRMVPATGIPMAGEAQKLIIDKDDKNEVAISVARLFAKLNKVQLKTGGVDVNIKEDGETPKFTLKGYCLINGLDSAYSFKTMDNANQWIWEKKASWNYLNNGYEDKKATKVYSGMEGTEIAWMLPGVETPVYMYENAPKRIKNDLNAEGYAKESLYALIIKGELKYEKSGETLTRYWRLNLNKEDEYKIQRNVIYNVVIKSVNTKGYATEKDADDDEDGGDIVGGADDTAILATIEIENWTIKELEEDI